MKLSSFSLPLSFVAAVGLAGMPLTPISAQTTASTNPVGFITLTVPGTSTGGGSSQLSFQGLGLVQTSVAQGTSTAVGANTLTDTTQSWTQDEFDAAAGPYYLEITGPTGASGLGTTYDITATNASTHTVTFAQNLAAGIAAGAFYTIRPHWTIASVFGATNQGGLQGGVLTSADQILIYNGSTPTTYYYSTGAPAGIGWRSTGTTDESGTILYENEGILIIRKQSSTASITLMGAVKTGQTSAPILTGLNIVANPYAAPMTLGNSGLYTDATGTTGLMPGTATSADQVLIYNPSTSTYTTYYYSSGGLAGPGWRSTGPSDQNSVQLPVGESFLIQRKASTAFNWVAPQTPSSF